MSVIHGDQNDLDGGTLEKRLYGFELFSTCCCPPCHQSKKCTVCISTNNNKYILLIPRKQLQFLVVKKYRKSSTKEYQQHLQNQGSGVAKNLQVFCHVEVSR